MALGLQSVKAVIAVSAVSLLLIVIVTLTQCLLSIQILRMRCISELQKSGIYAEVVTPSTMYINVSVAPNEAYGVHKMASLN